jgi:hypothetical protein
MMSCETKKLLRTPVLGWEHPGAWLRIGIQVLNHRSFGRASHIIGGDLAPYLATCWFGGRCLSYRVLGSVIAPGLLNTSTRYAGDGWPKYRF